MEKDSRALLTTRKILGVRIHAVTRAEVRVWLRSALSSKNFHHVVTPNPEFLLEAERNVQFQEVLNHADLSIPDGVGLRLASFVTAGPMIPERITGIDTMELIAECCEQLGKHVVLFGGFDQVAVRAAQELKNRYPTLRVDGLPDVGRVRNVEDHAEQLLQRIQSLKPDVLIVALGSPLQDLWIAKHRQHLPSVVIAMGVGGALDYLSGEKKRAPRWMRNFGLEWLFRLLKEPGRLTRIVRATILFPFEVLISSFQKQSGIAKKFL